MHPGAVRCGCRLCLHVATGPWRFPAARRDPCAVALFSTLCAAAGVARKLDASAVGGGAAAVPAMRSPKASVALARKSFGHIFRNKPFDG